MPWTIRQPDGTTILDSATEFGLYLIDVDSVQFTADAVGQQRIWNFNYSSEAARLYPLLIPNGYVISSLAGGWAPKITNWTGETDTSFTVDANDPNAPTGGGLTNPNNHGWTLYVFATRLTAAQQALKPRFEFQADVGGRSVISPGGAPLRYVGSSTPTALTEFSPPTLTGGGSPFDVETVGVIKPGTSVSNGTALGPAPGGSQWWRGGTASSAETYWFDTKWPRTSFNDSTQVPFIRMKEINSPNRVFFDSRERYLRVLDIQIETIPDSAYVGFVVPHLAADTVLCTFNSSTVPNDDTWGVISNIGGEDPFGSSLVNGGFYRDGRQLKVSTGGSFSDGPALIPRQFIGIAVDLTDF